MNKKILIVEDDSFLQGLEVAELQKHDLTVSIAQDGTSGLAAIEKDKPDLVLLDLMMPGAIDGFGVLEAVRKNEATKNLPVIVFTNFGDEERMQKAVSLGATDSLIKSNVTLTELAEKIKGLVG
jgi:DNA-binding response OmpR family regulator